MESIRTILTKGRLLTTVVFVSIIGISLIFFQNCAPNISDSGDTTLSSLGYDTPSGDSRYRLPASPDSATNSGVTCSATASSSNVGLGGSYTYTVTTAGNPIGTGYKVAVYGNKNGFPDASEIMPESYTSLNLPTFTNPNDGSIGGIYTRYFQVYDSIGRTLCQTNEVQVTLQGKICTLSINAQIFRVGAFAILNIGYGSGTAVPSGGSLHWEGYDNNQAISPAPFQPGASTTQYIEQIKSPDVGKEIIRRVVVKNSDNSIYCRTNYVRFRVAR